MKRPGLLNLREMPAEDLVSEYEDYATEQFCIARKFAAPDVVVLPACNEEKDIPAALFSLSGASRPVVPIVIENGSGADDKTYEYAERMGAMVLQCEPAKMRATQLGLQASRELFPKQPIINFGDADNLYPKRAVAAVSDAAHAASKKNDDDGALVFGMGVYDHGESLAVDIMRTGRLFRKAVERKLKGKSPMPYGFNYALHTDKDGRVVEAIGSLDPLLFVREESEICIAALSVGLVISQSINPNAVVYTRSDLIRNLAEWRRFKGAPMGTKVQYYERNYPEVDFLPNSNGR